MVVIKIFSYLKNIIFKKRIIFIVLLACMTNISVYADWEGYKQAIDSGAKTYFRFCSVCHGGDGQGNGSYAINLTTPPPNLTRLAEKNNALFPWKQAYESIDGRSKHLAHGTTEMPVWSQLFDLRSWGQDHTEFADVIVRGRIFELLLYLESIQHEGVSKYSTSKKE